MTVGRCARGHQCACVGELRGLRPACMEWRPAALQPSPAAPSLMIDQDWLNRRVESDPESPCEAGGPSSQEQAVMVCPQCEGEGSYADGVDEAAVSMDCTRCGGNGWIVDLAALPPVSGGGLGEPVAWQIEDSDDGWVFFDPAPAQKNPAVWAKHGWNVRALYARQQAAVSPDTQVGIANGDGPPKPAPIASDAAGGLREEIAELLVNQTRAGTFGYTHTDSLPAARQVADAILALSAPPVHAGEAGAWPEKWSGDCTVGNFIANLSSLPPEMPLYTAYHIPLDEGSMLKVKRPTLSRERVVGTNIKTGDESVPYSAVIWTQPRDQYGHPSSGEDVEGLREKVAVALDQARRGADKAGCDGWRAQEMCRQIVQLLEPVEAALSTRSQS